MPKWNDALERKLLLCIITYAELKTISWDKIAELMGDDVSSEACRQHFGKLKKEITSTSGDPSTPKGKTLPPVSGSGKSTSIVNIAGKRKKGGKDSAQEDDVEAFAAGDGSPQPKKPRKAKAKPKAEVVSETPKSEDKFDAGFADKE